MISISYVNDSKEPLLLSDPYLKFESAIEEIDNGINALCTESINIYNKIMFETAVMGEPMTEAKKEEIKKSSSNIFESIGNAILKVVEKIKDLVKNIISKMSGFEKKSDLDKLQAAAKGKDPEVVQGLYDAFKSGKLTVYDAKSIKDIEDAYLEFLKYANQKSVDPNTLNGKFEIFKKKCKDADKSGLVSVSKALVTIASAAVIIPTIRKTLADTKKSTMDASEKMIKHGENLAEYITKMQDSEDPNVRDAVKADLGEAAIKKNAYMFMTGQYEKMIQKNEDTYSRIMEMVKSALTKIDKKGIITSKIDASIQKKSDKKIASGNSFLAGTKAHNDVKNPPVDREKERQKNMEDVSDRTKAQKEAELKFNKEHKKELSSAAYGNAKAQSNAKIDAEREDYAKNRDNILDTVYDKSKAQQQGREAGTDLKNVQATAEAQEKGRNAAKPKRSNKK